ncbi:MAG: hypothetical protein CMP10_18975 [Zetaproteobacteria bacterium]|nr:hypothetical protein [Pseudobdellovibrionaceae bacterium]
MKRIVLSLTCLLPLACTKPLNSYLQSEIPGNHDDIVALGSGYTSVGQKTLPVTCISSDEIDTASPESQGVAGGNAQATVQYLKDETLLDVARVINGSASAEVKFSMVRAAGNAELAKEHSSDEYSLTYSYLYHGVAGKRYIYRLNNMDLVPAVLNWDGNRFQRFCGDEFVSSIQYGAVLIGTLKVTFQNAADKLDIKGALELDFETGGLGVAVEGEGGYLSEDVKKTAKVSFIVEQQGGDPAGYLGHLPAGITDCSLENLGPCQTAIKGLIEYGNGDFKKQLMAESNNETNEQLTKRLMKWNVVNITTTPYTDLPFLSMDVQTDSRDYSAMRSNINVMEEMYDQERKSTDRADFLINTGFAGDHNLSEREKVQVEDIRRMAKANSDLLFSQIKRCLDQYQTPSVCTVPALQDYTDLMPLLSLESTDIGEIQPGTYVIGQGYLGTSMLCASFVLRDSTPVYSAPICDQADNDQKWQVTFEGGLGQKTFVKFRQARGATDYCLRSVVSPRGYTVLGVKKCEGIGTELFQWDNAKQTLAPAGNNEQCFQPIGGGLGSCENAVHWLKKL